MNQIVYLLAEWNGAKWSEYNEHPKSCKVPRCLSYGDNYSSLQQAAEAQEKLTAERWQVLMCTNTTTDTHWLLKMAIVCTRCVSLTCIIPPSTSFNQHIYMNTHIEIRVHTYTDTHTRTVTYVRKHSRLLVVVMVFCSTLRCNGPRHCSVRAISLL